MASRWCPARSRLGVHHPSPWVNIQRLDCFPWGPFPLHSVFVGGGGFSKVLGSSKSCNKLDTPARYTGYLFCILRAQKWSWASFGFRSP